ncbi:hypothetical protein L9F63_027293 [Diploptera punctata]|uniref:Uncharacterized protein n=1 Tax=Diploptera punctata TaxID=6984 RepID=A0AAD8ABM8_DIPPU|nr:hypothetical protein L9F63_027293 [Diploptera punctata]
MTLPKQNAQRGGTPCHLSYVLVCKVAGTEDQCYQHKVSSVFEGQSHGGTSPGRDDEYSLSTQLHHFLASLTKSRGFYANLAESLCSDESFAETRDTADCWNGQRIGE